MKYKTPKLSKSEFSNKLQTWLQTHLQTKYSTLYDISISQPNIPLSKNRALISHPNYPGLDFKIDVMAILKNKSSLKSDFVILNRSIKPIDLREIGELLCYSKLIQPIESFIISPSGLSKDVHSMLLVPNVNNNLLSYYNDKKIIIGNWNLDDNDPSFYKF